MVSYIKLLFSNQVHLCSKIPKQKCTSNVNYKWIGINTKLEIMNSLNLMLGDKKICLIKYGERQLYLSSSFNILDMERLEFLEKKVKDKQIKK